MGLAESICPFPTSYSEEFLRILPTNSRSLQDSEEPQHVGSTCHPGTVCSSAQAGAQRRRLAMFLRGWLSTEESTAERASKPVSCCSCDKQSLCVQQWEVFLWTLGNKRHRAGRSGCSKGLATSILQKAHCPQPCVSLELGHSDI